MTEYVYSELAPLFGELISDVLNQPGIFWTVLPFMVAALAMQIYFGRNRTEELGWNSAFGNSVAFAFVSASLLRYLFTTYETWEALNVGDAMVRLWITVFVLLTGLLMAVANLEHARPKKFFMFLSQSAVINGLGVMAIILVQTTQTLDQRTIAAAGLFLVVFTVLQWLVREAVRPSSEAEHVLRKQREKEEELRKLKIANRRRLQTLRIKKCKHWWHNLQRKLGLR
ncbi:MAG: hypothetical protein QF486_04155 [Candidatus Woesearchaeota archaeon]|jgi:hypothetical protein|nr:hypothetical protein [Candidatus Woesearchaeota archaeon]MDP7181696.1 hypothetical protein [Candidatus Woesearchaeota archaeon]MDP7198785.1 hypothetical protein [Candidatus Woesearchaeota archaeon]MDP7467215.1 hypothetical protein [Candidatus Woesearchaeota archaeon]MDP7647450.1 hypothetical protein [Candidatus Woesearchaeota archaeon]